MLHQRADPTLSAAVSPLEIVPVAGYLYFFNPLPSFNPLEIPHIPACYVLINPLQLAVMPARLGSGKLLQPRLLMNTPRKPVPLLDVNPEHLAIVRNAMTSVVNDHGTAVASKLPLDGILMAGKTGTAQVFRLGERGHQGNWALRDHALFIAFAPADQPRYAIGCIIEHGGFGASAAAPIVRDSMTYLFDKQKALAALAPLEEQWGGTLAERNARQLQAFKSVPRTSA
jgi:penicillin-binding protein 2